MLTLQNWRPLKIGGPRRLPSLPNERTGPGQNIANDRQFIISNNISVVH